MKKILVVIFIIAVLAIGYYAISPLFNVVERNDEVPAGAVPSGSENLSSDRQEQLSEMMDEKNGEPVSEMNEAMPEVMTKEEVIPEEVEKFPIMGTVAHPAGGYVKVLKTDSGDVIRYEEFSTINGPNLHVYLAKDLRANEYVDLGEIKGTKGNINYSVPAGVKVEEYKYVMYWCVPFSVLFNYAEIN